MKISEETRKYVETLRESPNFGVDGFDFEGLREGMQTRREPADRAVRCLTSQIDGLGCEWVIAPGADPQVRLLYLHGGGYVSGSGAYYIVMAALLSAAARCAVLLLDYRLAPEHPFPAGLEDCIRGHEWMRASGPGGPAAAKATFIGGDSAGGGLTLATMLALRDRQRPLPKAGITLSVWTDLTLSGESIRSEAELDPIMCPRALPEFVKLYIGDGDPRHPYISPVFADYRGIPPLLIQVGEHEVIRDDSVRVAAKAQADGVRVSLEVWPGLFHVFQSHEPLLEEGREGREAIEHIGAFIRAQLP